MYKRILTAGLLFGMVATGPPASAATCGQRDLIVENLANVHAEQLSATGLQSPTAMVEVFSSAETGTFTILVSHPSGISCVVSTGQYWTPHAPVPRGVSG